MSKGKKIFAIIFGIILVLFLAVVGMGAKLYWDVSKSMDKTYETVERSKKSQVNLNNKEPFSVLLLGIDTGDDGRVEQGRSDTTIVATVNPRDKQTTLVSLARDTYVDIPGQGKQDKLNHAYAFGGASLAMDTVENYLNIPINHYVSINMAGLKELVNAVGGIEVNNNLTFSQDGYDFTIGKISLDGEQALSYSRMRYEDPNGDYGRQERQRKVIEGIVQKVLSLNSVSNYQEILTAVSDNMKTDLSFDDMKKIALDYRSAFGKVKQDQLQGTGFMQDGVSYQRVNEQELTRVQQELKNQLNTK
ncbi:LCP family protein [Enterococcus faecalis]|jgi:LCP family protein required for cell wall assembly|uniref:LCP family glycopolymer transferase n=1 Tax=Enterococcus TaxID=1350 RepID=UPI00065F89B3|nr:MULTISPECIES: LCP family protein [Enterococcus]EGO2825006.1 LytR family transcriptional regulator [Enterococcus faecalis]EGO7552916.1 LytR family transcriptional regulator [Enterococcus faecalis]EGO9396310.1 LytR family transcriptional regulator [Enterococcus faecalis]EGS7941806.1 LytR family transcriptional regulator [Enterococcus faecalis]EHB6469668.1 LytR family transcriptional regulator [Enterococcus faecalis]